MNSIRSATTSLSRVELESLEKDEEEKAGEATPFRYANKQMSEQGRQLSISQKTSVVPTIDSIPWRIRAMQPTGESTIMT